MRIVLKLTGACNLRCGYCYAGRGGRVRRTDRRAMIRSFDTLVERVPRGKRDVVFFGGEPLLRFELLRAAVLAHPECAFTLNTNGTLLDAGTAGFLSRNGISVSLALDGKTETHDRHRRAAGGSPTHARVVRAFELLSKAGVPTAVRMTVTPASAGHVRDDALYLAGIGVTQLGIAPAANIRWGPRPIQRLDGSLCALAAEYERGVKTGVLPRVSDFERAREGRAAACNPGVDTMTIEPDGTVLPCHRSPVSNAARLIVDSAACSRCPALRDCTRCVPKLGSKRQGPQCRLKLAFARAYDIVRTANAGGNGRMEKYTVIEGKLYKIPPDVLKKYQLSEEDAHKAKAAGKAPKAPKAEPPLKGNWYELGESDCF